MSCSLPRQRRFSPQRSSTFTRASGCGREGAVSASDLILLAICAALLGYLLYALLNAEDF